jgi:hypothetical protein
MTEKKSVAIIGGTQIDCGARTDLTDRLQPASSAFRWLSLFVIAVRIEY